MFDFENLNVYHKARELRREIFLLLSEKKKVDLIISNQLKRAAVSVVLNIAEGTGKTGKADKRNFYTIARGSTYEIVAVIDILQDDGIINMDERDGLYALLETISKMLLGLINSTK
jgi:four helix bundle protein